LSEQYKLARDTQVYTTPASNGYPPGRANQQIRDDRHSGGGRSRLYLIASSQKSKWSCVMTTTTNNREHNNRELTDAELLDVCGGTDNVLEAVGVRLEAVAKAASNAASTIVKAF
jgi:hypothetical protein